MLNIPADRITVVSVVPGSASVEFEVSPSAQFSFGSKSYSQLESPGHAALLQITVTRTMNIFTECSVHYSTPNRTATAMEGTHFQPTSGVLTFANSEVSKTFNVSVGHDGVHASTDVQFALNLFNASNAVLGDIPSTVVTLVNVDPPAPASPTASFPSPDSLRVSWAAPEWTAPEKGFSVNTFDVQLRLVSATNWTDVVLNTTAVSVVATGLETYSQYVFRVRAHNAAGWSEYSEDSSPSRTAPLCGDGARDGSERVSSGGGVLCSVCVLVICTGTYATWVNLVSV